MPIIGAHHTCYTVRDMAASLAFYRDLLGFEIASERPEVTAAYFRTIIGFPDARVYAVLLKIPGTSHMLELLQYLHPAGTPQDLTPNNPGSSHVCYLVDDLDAMYEKLRAANVTFISSPTDLDQGPNVGGKALYLRDPNGAVIELFQRAPQA